MTSKERVSTAFAHQAPDRVPIDFFANRGIYSRLLSHFGLGKSNHEELLQVLGVDFRAVRAPYAGPKLHEDVPDRQVDMWGIHRKWIEHESGGYFDYCDFPLKDASAKEIANWAMPSPDDFDYSVVPDFCESMKEYCVVAGDAGTVDIINSAGMIRTMEQVLVDLATNDPAGMLYIDRKIAVQLEVLERTLEAGDGAIDLLCIGEDLGTQIGPMIGLDLFRKQIRPRHQRFVDLGKHYGIPVMIHSCGSSSWAFEDFIEMGIGVIDTLQPEAKDMAPAYLKGRFGDRLAFHGCLSTAGPVAYGSPQDTVDNVRKVLSIMMPGGGFAASPTHALQDNSPTENVVAMYEALKEHGKYRGNL